MQIRIPGNLLIAGEYAITEAGGMGIAIGIDRHVVAKFSEREKFEIIGRYANDEVRIAADCAGDSLPALVCRHVISDLKIDKNHLSGRWIIDSTDLYREGDKLGYGSSAATTIATCVSVLHSAKMSRDGSMRALPSIAVGAHRALQSQRASGYDILASINGGIGLFTGGATPSWCAISAPWLESIWIMHASAPVQTRGAVDRYNEWKSRNQIDASRTVENSNREVGNLAKSKSGSEARRHLDRLRKIGVELGRAIGVPADPPADVMEHIARGAAGSTAGAVAGPVAGASARAAKSTDSSQCFYKALGAGNELIGSFFCRGRPGDGFEPVRIDRDGTAWR